MFDLFKRIVSWINLTQNHRNAGETDEIFRKVLGMFNGFKWAILLLILVNLGGCSDGNPQVDFLMNPSIQKEVKPGSSSSINLSLTTVVTGGGYQLKGRVTSLETQKELSGGSYKIKGRISF